MAILKVENHQFTMVYNVTGMIEVIERDDDEDSYFMEKIREQQSGGYDHIKVTGMTRALFIAENLCITVGVDEKATLYSKAKVAL